MKIVSKASVHWSVPTSLLFSALCIITFRSGTDRLRRPLVETLSFYIDSSFFSRIICLSHNIAFSTCEYNSCFDGTLLCSLITLPFFPSTLFHFYPFLLFLWLYIYFHFVRQVFFTLRYFLSWCMSRFYRFVLFFGI